MATYECQKPWVTHGPGGQVLPVGTLVGDGTPYPLTPEQEKLAEKVGTLKKVPAPKPVKAEPAEKADPGPSVIDPSKEYKPPKAAKIAEDDK